MREYRLFFIFKFNNRLIYYFIKANTTKLDSQISYTVHLCMTNTTLYSEMFYYRYPVGVKLNVEVIV